MASGMDDHLHPDYGIYMQAVENTSVLKPQPREKDQLLYEGYVNWNERESNNLSHRVTRSKMETYSKFVRSATLAHLYQYQSTVPEVNEPPLVQ